MALIDNPDAARRLARAIASDVSLYNEEKIIQGILNDNLFDVMNAEIEAFCEKQILPKKTRHNVLLLVEVSDTTLDYDHGLKLALYARAGIPEVWVVNLPDEVVEVYALPKSGRYQEAREARRGETIESSRNRSECLDQRLVSGHYATARGACSTRSTSLRPHGLIPDRDAQKESRFASHQKR